MKTMKHPIRSTILYGLVCGLIFVPLNQMLIAFIPWSQAICLVLWLFLAGYALMLNLWSKKKQGQTIFPLLILLPAILLNNSGVLFFILALIAAGWIRSGICFSGSGARGIAVELLLGFLDSWLVLVFTPGSVYAWAVGTWMFFLTQALYFAFFDTTVNHKNNNVRLDAFDEVSKKAEQILSGGYFS